MSLRHGQNSRLLATLGPMKNLFIAIACFLTTSTMGFVVGCSQPKTSVSDVSNLPARVAEPTVPVAHSPYAYRCHFARNAPKFDGKLEEEAWAKAPWTREFTDIEGGTRPLPRHTTRVKMLWDDQFLYVAAYLEEPDLWATYDEHDMIVFHENDFEVFVDPDGDGREYYEIEINVIGTVFDLFLHRPYREGGPAEHGWHASGMKTAIHTTGTVNNPLDRDESWVVELAIPWSDFQPPKTRMDGTPWVLPPIREHLRSAEAPRDGETWRINFSRVHWDLQVVDETYQKVPDRPEYNWTWTPQWEINMHVPEHWGFLEFTKQESSL